ncbi:proline racemase family protein [Kutzneria sp. CA-103260]|uniref:proline racemase family protein n=1 Tax=Kutzneria sp. CA-103260 TaxID=2802641 RepID=UPI001BAB02FD|nr:proline racemase family protein [Kutzneria sp. CA-103260]QUQ67502.1 proline racemase [Kutzneria sp. CA-103260]
MSGTLIITSVDAHAEGEPGRILLGSHLQVRGTTMSERLRWCTEHMDDLRMLLLREPRGHPAMCGVLVLPPVTDTADVALIILEQGGFRPMSGSNTICAVTALLETGALPMRGPETVVRIDTAAGLVEATASVSGGKVTRVRVRNVPSWVVALDTPLEMPEYGTVLADVAFGGQFYVLVPASAMGVKLGAENAPTIVRAGAALLAAARAQVEVHHPDDPNLGQISLAMLHGPADSPGVSAQNSVVMPTGELDIARPETWRGALDRSPCGTGTSARMACLHARGELALGVPFVHQGVLGTTFEGLLHERVRFAGHDAVVPSIAGQAWITGINQHVLHPDDPFPRGYAVGDVWGTSSVS